MRVRALELYHVSCRPHFLSDHHCPSVSVRRGNEQQSHSSIRRFQNPPSPGLDPPPESRRIRWQVSMRFEAFLYLCQLSPSHQPRPFHQLQVFRCLAFAVNLVPKGWIDYEGPCSGKRQIVFTFAVLGRHVAELERTSWLVPAELLSVSFLTIVTTLSAVGGLCYGAAAKCRCPPG